MVIRKRVIRKGVFEMWLDALSSRVAFSMRKSVCNTFFCPLSVRVV